MLKLLILCLVVISCGKKEKKASYNLAFYNKASVFSQKISHAFGGDNSVEASLLNVNGEVVAMHDPGLDGSLWKSNLGDGSQFYNKTYVGTGYRFSFVFAANSHFYTFALVGSDIYLWKSSDLINWTKINNNQPVLSAEGSGIYKNLWNVAVAVDADDTWHLLVESANGLGPAESQGGVGLAYTHATMNGDSINFNTNKSATHVIPKGGNPHIEVVNGGLLVIHGQLNDPLLAKFGHQWYVTASTFKNGTWTTHKDFSLGKEGIHVCDPSLVETSQGLVMSVSVDQNSTYIASADGYSFQSLFDLLTL